jgi:hypothetical protein
MSNPASLSASVLEMSASSASNSPAASSHFTNALMTDRHVLICMSSSASDAEALRIKEQFCGSVIDTPEALEALVLGKEVRRVFLMGDVADVLRKKPSLVDGGWLLLAIKGHTTEVPLDCIVRTGTRVAVILPVSAGDIALNRHDVGIHIRDCSELHESSCFEAVSREHKFQHLTESNKPGVAYRTGAYITPVEVDANGASRFHLLRCSSNFEGPTNQVQPTDRMILKTVTELSAQHFRRPGPFNHVLAQIYHNAAVNGREKKAGIKRHSDKSKDMHKDGLMAFCTFYEGYDAATGTFPKLPDVVRGRSDDAFDMHRRGVSVLTRLRFRRKDPVDAGVNEFDVVLYPNSVFLMSLDMNRLWTHEIVPSVLQIQYLPIRMGYVVRCASTEAVHDPQKNETFVVNNESKELVHLREPNAEERTWIKALYAEENLTSKCVDYGAGPIPFTLNRGDLLAPILDASAQEHMQQQQFQAWSWHFHNMVNQRLGEAPVSFDAALSQCANPDNLQPSASSASSPASSLTEETASKSPGLSV